MRVLRHLTARVSGLHSPPVTTFFGSVAATSPPAGTSPAVVYCLLASIGLACVPLVRLRDAGARV